MLKTLQTAAIALTLGAAGIALAADPTDPNKTDKKFVEEASGAGLTEVRFSELALKTSTDANVLKFAQMMVDDHSKANDALSKLATTKGLAPATDIPDGKKKDLEKLGKLTGVKFDQSYAKTMVSDHKDAVKLFTKEGKSGAAPDLKTFAEDTLPTLQHHSDMAEQLNKDVNGKKAAANP